MNSKKKIVIADDESNLRLLLQMILEEMGYVIFSAKDGVEALALCQKETPDLLITDYMMPRKNGLELCRELKSNQKLKHIPVIMCSALADQGLEQNSKDLGVEKYLAKPFSAVALKQTVESIFN